MKQILTEETNFMPDMDFSEYLKLKRIKMHLKQVEMAELIGVHPLTISRWELGVTAPPFDLCRAIVRKLGDDLLIWHMEK